MPVEIARLPFNNMCFKETSLESQKDISPIEHRPSVSIVSLFRKLLVVACFALGAILAWGISQYQARGWLAAEARSAQQNYHVVLARQAEWGQLVAQPATKMFHLRGQREWTGNSAALAWNNERRAGVIFLPPMPPAAAGTFHHLWARSASGPIIHCGLLEVIAGGGMALLRTEHDNPDGEVFFITAETSVNPPSPGDVRMMSTL